LLDSIFSVLTCIPVYLIARHSFGERAAKFAAWGWAFFPYAVYYSVGRVWMDCLGALIFAVMFVVALKLGPQSQLRDWAGWGALWGLLALTNPAALAVLPFLLGWIIWRSQVRAASVLLMLLVVFAIVSPWMIRNYRVFHRFIPLRDNFWMEVWFGNTGDLSEIIPDWAHPSTNRQEQAEFARLGELAYNQEKKQLVLEFVREHPAQFAGLCLRRASNWWTGYWSLNPAFLEAEPFTYPNMLFVTGTSVITFFGLWVAWRRSLPIAPYVLVLLFFPLVYYISHSELEYRHPIDPLMVVLAAYGVSVLFR
jgi:4-amino-4-deoxy-L-arabinose transferase-like glycosyltransferase